MQTIEHCIDDVIDIKTAAREAHARAFKPMIIIISCVRLFAGSAMAKAAGVRRVLAGASPAVKHFERHCQ
jgi:hypothetical protein